MFDIKDITKSEYVKIKYGASRKKGKEKKFDLVKVKFGQFFKIVCSNPNFRKWTKPEELKVLETGGIDGCTSIMIPAYGVRSKKASNDFISKVPCVFEFENDSDAELYCEIKKADYANAYGYGNKGEEDEE